MIWMILHKSTNIIWLKCNIIDTGSASSDLLSVFCVFDLLKFQPLAACAYEKQIIQRYLYLRLTNNPLVCAPVNKSSLISNMSKRKNVELSFILLY